MNTNEDIRKRLLVARLPSPPQTLLKLLSLCQSDDTGIHELADLIANDPALSAKVLKVAHSAAYHSADANPLTLLQACGRLGTALIKVLVISETVVQTFNGFQQASALDLRVFWKHSLSVALMARELAPRLNYESAEEAYLAGLLHDIGRLALLVVATQEAQPLFAALDDDALCAQEQHSLAMSHTEAGAWLLGRWRLSEHLVDSVSRHHEDAKDLGQAHVLTQILHLAHRMAAMPLDAPGAFDEFNCTQALTAADLQAVTQSATRQLEQVARDLGLDISAADQPASHLPTGQVPVTDALQAQMVQAVIDRSVLNEMAMTLIAQSSNDAALTQLRQHASALLQLEDSVVMLLRSNQQLLVPVSMNERHQGAALLSYDLTQEAVFESCVTTRKVVFTGRNTRGAIGLLNILASDELVLIPLISARNCLGILVAAVPDELSQHIHKQTPMLQAFGTYAGLALSRRRQATMSPTVLSAISKREQQLELTKMSQELSKQASPLGSVDLCLAVKELVQRVQDNRLVPGNIKVRCEFMERAALVRGSAGMVQLMALMLMRHAFERMQIDGEIVVSAGALAHRHGAMYTGMSVSDTAASSTQAIQAELFEPPPIASANDALSPNLGNVNRMVESMAGHLSFKTGDAGTRFDILLPCAKQLKLVA